jgi:hypothetical protein
MDEASLVVSKAYGNSRSVAWMTICPECYKKIAKNGGNNFKKFVHVLVALG